MDAAKSKEQQVFGGSSRHQRERFKTQKAPVGNVPSPKTKQQAPQRNFPSTDRNTTDPNGKGPNTQTLQAPTGNVLNTQRNRTGPNGKCPKNREKQNRPLREMS